MTVDELIAENHRRHMSAGHFDPLTGEGSSGPRRWVASRGAWLPEAMIGDRDFSESMPEVEYERLRCRHDFEFWAARCVRIRDKLTGREVPFVLNAPQRRVAATFEACRLSSEPIRFIMLKARQWGGSTLVQFYMAWIQTVLRRNWHSLICAHVKDTSATIRGMYGRMLVCYPDMLWEGDEGVAAAFTPFERSYNSRIIAGRNCCVTVASAENPEAVRGLDVSMAHLSEVAFWKDTTHRSAADFARAVCSGIPLEPLTLTVLESTANGVGNYFHTEWVRAEAGESDKTAVFVPWYEIEIYSMPVVDPMKLWNSMDPYERRLWEVYGLTLEKINWYHHKRREYPTHQGMQAEYPTTPVEAFITSGSAVFNPERVDMLRRGCSSPKAVGEVVSGLHPGVCKGRNALVDPVMREDSNGLLKVWHFPAVRAAMFRNKYVVAVDVGGRSEKSDWSVITVFERFRDRKPRVAAQWRGHIDHDLLGWKAAAIARYYGTALLVVESNTLESEFDGDSAPILEELTRVYPNLYQRTVRDTLKPALERRPGFHTNRQTKMLAVTALIAAVRDGDYEESDAAACNELDAYECTPSGGYSARRGHHDDMVMTRAIGLYVLSTLPAPAGGESAAVRGHAAW